MITSLFNNIITNKIDTKTKFVQVISKHVDKIQSFLSPYDIQVPYCDTILVNNQPFYKISDTILFDIILKIGEQL